MFNRVLIAGFLLVFVTASAYLWHTPDSQSNPQLSPQSTPGSALDGMAKKQPEPSRADKQNDQSGLVFDTAPLSRQQNIDPLEHEVIPDLPSLAQEERAAQAIIAAMDRLIEQEGLLDMPLNEEDEQTLMQRQEELQQRLDALSQHFDE